MALDNAPCGPLTLILVALVLREHSTMHPLRRCSQHPNPDSVTSGSGASSLPSNGATSVLKSIQLQSNAVQATRKRMLQDRHGRRGAADPQCILVLFNSGACGFAHRALTRRLPAIDAACSLSLSTCMMQWRSR